MTMLDSGPADVEDPEGGYSAGGLAGGDGELVLPEEVVAELAGRLAERARSGEPAALTGPDGLLSGIIGQVLQAGLAAELDVHLDGGDGEGNRRNGSSAKTLNTEVGPVRVAVPRDRAGTFEPALVPKQATRSEGLNAVLTSLYAKGMSVRDIARHVRQTTGVDLSHDTVSRVTDMALEAMREWQHRPLEPFYPVIYVDALVAKVRDGSAVRNKAVNVAVGIDGDGAKRVLGIWVAPAEGAKAWAQALAQLRNRGLEEVLFVCCDGLSGLGDEITATWPGTVVQTCTVHLIRRSLGYASYNDRKAMAQALREVYTACDADAAYAALAEFAGTPLGRKYPAAVAVWERAWDRFTPFLEYGPALRRVLYTTNAIESFNREMRKILKTRTQFPNDDSVAKTLWLAILDIEDKRAEQRARQAGKPKDKRDGAARLIEGHVTQGWHEAWGEMVALWPDRFADRMLRTGVQDAAFRERRARRERPAGRAGRRGDRRAARRGRRPRGRAGRAARGRGRLRRRRPGLRRARRPAHGARRRRRRPGRRDRRAHRHPAPLTRHGRDPRHRPPAP
jgi:putative transposase